MTLESPLECEHSGMRARREIRRSAGVEGEQIDVGGERLGEPGQGIGVLESVVATADQHVLESDATPPRGERQPAVSV